MKSESSTAQLSRRATAYHEAGHHVDLTTSEEHIDPELSAFMETVSVYVREVRVLGEKIDHLIEENARLAAQVSRNTEAQLRADRVLLYKTDIARRLGVSARTVQRLWNERGLAYRWEGQRRYSTQAQLDDYLRKQNSLHAAKPS